ncbi:hypothetical protein OJ998_22775 [Solirubrobacter taibaiensis]|nr:hypothetical protein [Solirubrobacter taibaiensis]
MPGDTIAFRVDHAERTELVARAAREKLNLSDYIRIRLGLRALGSEEDAAIIAGDSQDALRLQVADHEVRLRALEAR